VRTDLGEPLGFGWEVVPKTTRGNLQPNEISDTKQRFPIPQAAVVSSWAYTGDACLPDYILV
jgi:hypothetical protein